MSIEKMWESLGRYVSLPEGIWGDILLAAITFLVFLLIRGFFVKVVFKLALKLLSRTKTEVDDKILLGFENPLKFFIIVLGLYFALQALPLTAGQQSLLVLFFRSTIVFTVAWGLYNLAGVTSILFKNISETFNVQINQILIPFLSKILRFVIIVLAISIIAKEWGYDINGFIAGLGLGGLAFALAAQDALSNIFGGAIIIVDKPFDVGDWIYTPSVEGTVEDISFRSTKIRTFANALVTVPNSTLVKEPITNWTRMGKRRITFHLGVAYTTPREKLERCIAGIQQMLENHPEVHPETIFVRFDRFSDSSLDIFLYFFTKTTVWKEYLAIKEEINFKIMEILENEGVSIALPSRSIYFRNPLDFQESTGRE